MEWEYYQTPNPVLVVSLASVQYLEAFLTASARRIIAIRAARNHIEARCTVYTGISLFDFKPARLSKKVNSTRETTFHCTTLTLVLYWQAP
jgi:hypothetical protein